jgi:hypothetical protein
MTLGAEIPYLLMLGQTQKLVWELQGAFNLHLQVMTPKQVYLIGVNTSDIRQQRSIPVHDALG